MRNKHFLIIGGTHGIGKEIVRSLQSKKYHITVVGRKTPDQKQKKNINYWTIDLLDEKKLSTEIKNMLTKIGNISHIIFCQRFRGSGDNWQSEFQVSLTATKQIIEETSSYFDTSKEKSIVIIASLASFFIGRDQPISYHVMKSALLQLVRYFAVTLGPLNIRVNSIAPCTILKEESKHFYLDNKKLHSLYKRIIPLGRMGTAKEISDIAEFLCSSGSTFITGQNIIADGGLSLISQERLARDLSFGGN